MRILSILNVLPVVLLEICILLIDLSLFKVPWQLATLSHSGTPSPGSAREPQTVRLLREVDPMEPDHPPMIGPRQGLRVPALLFQ